MEPNSLGRKLGIGMRVAGNIARERAAAAAREREKDAAGRAPAQPATNPIPSRPSVDVGQRGRQLGVGIGRGTKSFSQSFFGPLAHAGNVLWLEITGCFFALFTAFFAQNVYQLRAQSVVGAQHQKFILYVGLTGLFLYFSASSFISARRRARKQRAARHK